MKRNLLILLLAVFTSPLLTKAGTVTIVSANDSAFGPLCPTPQTIDFMIWGNTTGYINITDSVDIYVDFGDGGDTTFKSVIQPQFWGWFPHTYNISGQFSVTYIVTGPDLAADTLIVYNEIFIGDTCGTIDGQVYLDANNDCVYNAGDTYLPYMQVKLLQGNNLVGWDWTDATGHYWFTI